MICSAAVFLEQIRGSMSQFRMEIQSVECYPR